MSEKCPNCGQLTNSSFSRLVKDSCGHLKCRLCLLYEEQGCKACHNEIRIENVRKYDCSTTANQILNDSCTNIKDSSKEEVVLPLELVINKNSKSKENNVEFPSVSCALDSELHCRKNVFNGKDDLCKARSKDGAKNAEDKLYIPKIEPCDVISNIRTHLNTNNLVTIKNTNTAPNEAEKINRNDQGIKSQFPSKPKCKPKHPDRSHISIVPGDPVKYKCNVCCKTFRNKKGKCYHDACVTGIRPYQCTHCDKSFVKRSHFEYHERIHSGYKPYKCELCNKAFPQQSKLNRHMYSHCKEKQFGCSECDKKYSKKDDLKNHLIVHTSTTTYSCKTCEKPFRLLTNLKRHMRTHTTERPHTCDQCNKSFKDKYMLIRHKRIHGKERPFSCAHCNRVFLSKSELRRHMTVHSDEKPFSCEYCQTVFRRKDNLNRHIRHHHSEQSILENNKSQEILDTAKKSQEMKPTNNNKIKQKQKSKKIHKLGSSNCSSKSPSKLSVVYVNSREQINSRLDSMGNITPVIRTTGELSNAVPVINGPISIKKSEDKVEARKKTFTYTEPIPLAEAVVLNRRIEEKLYPQNSSNHNYFFRNQIHRNEKNSLLISSTTRTNFYTTKESIGANSNSKRTMEFESTNNSMNNSGVELVNNGFSNEIKGVNNSFEEEQINHVSIIKKHSNIFNDNVTPGSISLPKSLENPNNSKMSNVHWRRRTAEILKPCNQ